MDSENLEGRLQLLEKRVAILEKSFAAPSLGGEPLDTESGLPKTSSTTTRSWNDLEPVERLADNELSNKNEDIINKSVKSGNWLGIIATICFVLAAGFIIKLSVETGWLTPERQIIIAGLFGISLIAAGFLLLNTYLAYASLLPASGIIILYLAVFAGHLFYELTSFNSALIMTNIVSVLCIGLYWKFRHDIYAIVAALGAYLAPIILNLNAASFFTVYYFLCCSLAFTIISIWTRSRTMTILSAYLAILSTFIIGLNLNQNFLIASALALHFMIFSVGTYLYSICNKQHLSEYESWTFFPVLMLFYALEYYLIDSLQPNLAPWLSLLFAGLLIGLYLLAKKWVPNQEIKSQSMIYAFASIVFFHSFYLELVPLEFKPWLFVLLMVFFALLPKKYISASKSSVFYLPIVVVALILLMEYADIIIRLLRGYDFSILLAAAASYASIWLVMSVYHEDISKKEEHGALLLASAHLLAIVGLYRLADDYGSLAVTSCWLFYAVLIMTFAYRRRDKFMAQSALLVLGLAAGKALLYDASMTPTAVRILCLLLTGVVLYGAGFLMKKIAEWEA